MPTSVVDKNKITLKQETVDRNKKIAKFKFIGHLKATLTIKMHISFFYIYYNIKDKHLCLYTIIRSKFNS